LPNEPQEMSDAECVSEDAAEDAALAAYRDAHYRRRRFRILLGIVLVVALAYLGIGKLLRAVATKVMASESERAAVTTLKGMLWWAVRDENSNDPSGAGLPENPFGKTLFASFLPFPFSPLVIYGALLAAHVYAGHTPAENMHLVDVTYEHAFQFFRTAKFSMPAIDLAAISFDPTVAFGYVAALGHIDSLDAAELLEGAHVLNAFSYALSILKTLVSVCAGVLAWGGELGVIPNVPFHVCAHWTMRQESTTDVPKHIAGLDALVDEAPADAGDNANVEMAENPVHDEAAPRAVVSEAEAPAPPPHRDSAVV